MKTTEIKRIDSHEGAAALLEIVQVRVEAYRWAASRARTDFLKDLFKSLLEQDQAFKFQLQATCQAVVRWPILAKEWRQMVANVSLPPTAMSVEDFFAFMAHLHLLEAQAATRFLRGNPEADESWQKLLRRRQQGGQLLGEALPFLDQFEPAFV
jgi:hypothetical protein